MKGVVLLLAALLAATIAGSAAASVTKVSFTPRVSAGDEASLTVRVAPRARCKTRSSTTQ